MIKRLIAITIFLLLFLVMSVVSVFIFPGFINNASMPDSSFSGNQSADEPSRWETLKNWSAENAGSIALGKNKTVITELALMITAGLDNDYDKMVAVYDWVTENIAYDLDKAENLSAYGSGAVYVLETGQGVCHDYAELTKALLAAVEIEATYEKGEVIPAAGETELHAWNNVLINERWYALDTTWGSGYFLEDGSGFAQKPTRIYMTSPEELERLHSDPEYKQKRELEYLREKSINKPVVHLSEAEHTLFALSNDYRNLQELSLFFEEKKLVPLARFHSANFAEVVCAGNEFSLEKLSDELSRQAVEMNIKSAAINAYSKWLYHPNLNTDILRLVISDHAEYLEEEQWEALAVGTARKGDLIVIIFIFIEYY